MMPTSDFIRKEHVSPSCVQVEWNNSADPTKGFKYIYLSDADYSSIAARADTAVLKAEPFYADNGAVLNPARDCNLGITHIIITCPACLSMWACRSQGCMRQTHLAHLLRHRVRD